MQAALLVSAFKPKRMRACQAFLLGEALKGNDVHGAMLPEELTGGSPHLSGCVFGSLISMGLLVCIGRIKSPKENAKGRKLDLCRLPNEKRPAAKAFLVANGFPVSPSTEPHQMSLAV